VSKGALDLNPQPKSVTAFLSIHGITKGILQHLQKALQISGVSPKDKRGKDAAICNKLSAQTHSKILDHIKSFKGRMSHYSLHDSKKTYLSENLNIKKMYLLFKKRHPEVKVSYETYKQIFNTKFNIGFVYPRSDTCSTCDKFTAEMNRLKATHTPKNETKIHQLEVQNELHKRKAQRFYDKKRIA